MANSNAPIGLRPVKYLSGAPYNGAVNRYFIPSTDNVAAYIGGLVKPAGSADANGVQTVTANVAGADKILGVIVGVEPITADSTIYRAASVARYVYVADDPALVFEAQEDAVGGALAVTNVGQMASLIGFTSGSTVTGFSSIQVDSSTAAAPGSASLDVRIFGFVQRPDNEVGVANAKMLVTLNNSIAYEKTGV